MSAISGVCEGAGWLLPTRQLTAANGMRIVGARYGSLFTVLVTVGLASGTLYGIARAVKEVAAVGEVVSRTELNRAETDARGREAGAFERKAAKEEDLLDAQIALTNQQREREVQETLKARLDAEKQAIQNTELRDELFERRGLAQQTSINPSFSTACARAMFRKLRSA